MVIHTPGINLLRETGVYSFYLIVHSDGYAQTMKIDKKGRICREQQVI